MWKTLYVVFEWPLNLNFFRWRPGPDLPVPTYGAALVEDPRGPVIFIGGFDGSSNLATIYKLDHVGSGSKWIKMDQKLKVARQLIPAFLIPDRLVDCN